MGLPSAGERARKTLCAKFYLNKPGWGLLYLMFCWTFIPAIIGFLEALFYIFMTDGEFQAKYT